MKYFIPTIILIVLLVFAGVYSFKRGEAKAAAYYQWQIDTLIAVCNEKPDTINIIDTVWDTKVVYKDKYIPTPVSPGEYRDTVRTADLDFWIHDYTTGTILSRETGYSLKVPKFITDTTIIYKNVPKFIEVEKIVKIENTAYLRASIGPGYYSVGYGKIFNNRHALGASVILYDTRPNICLDYTYFINNKKQ